MHTSIGSRGLAAAMAAVLSVGLSLFTAPSHALAENLPQASASAEYEQRVIAKASSLDTTEGGEVIAHEGDLWLLGYDSKEDAENAAKQLDAKNGVAAAVDTAFGVAEGTTIDPNTTTTASKEDNPLSNEASAAISWKGAIALIDTGASGTNVIDKVTVLSGSADDDMGHGTRMARYMSEVAPDAKVVSIKALDANGTGTISSVVAAMDKAIENHVKVINLSISAKATEENSVISKEIQKAWDAGIMVVGAAGNDGQDASGFVPGGIDSAFIVGACDADGNKVASSNYGATVDYNVLASSTSEAAAKASAWLAKNATKATEANDVNAAVNKGLFFPTDPASYVPTGGNAGSGSDGRFHTQDYVSGWRVDDVANNYFVLFMNIQDVRDVNALCQGIAQNTGGTAVTTTELHGSWTRNGVTYTSAFIFSSGSLNVNSDVWLRVEQPANDWIMMVRLDGSGDTSSNRTGSAINIYTPGSHPHSPSIVTFNPNGGSVGTTTMNVETGHAIGGNLDGTNLAWDITNNIPTRDGYRFDGWYTEANGGTQVTTGSQWGFAQGVADYQNNFKGITKGNFWHVLNDGSGWGDLSWVYPWDITLYAHWTDIRYYIAFNGNGADSGAMTDSTATRDSAFTLPANAFSKVGYEFAGWNTKADGSGTTYADKASVTNLAEAKQKVTLYAQWHAASYTVSFDKNASDAAGTMAPQVMPSAKATNLNTHTYTRFGYEFTGWNTKADGSGTTIADGASVKDLAAAGKTATLYAQWKPIDTTVNMGNGVFYVRIKAGEIAHINGLPAGTTYKVEEQTPAGWTLIDSSGTEGIISSRKTSKSWFENSSSEKGPIRGTAVITAYKTIDGSRPSDGEYYTFQLKDSTGKVIDTQKSADGGIVTFKTLKYQKDTEKGIDDTGTHVYTVSEVKGNDSSMTYDTHIETVTVKVEETTDSAGNKYLKATPKTDASGVTFNNTHNPGTLELKKIVQGTASTNVAFSYEVSLRDPDNNPVKSITATTYTNGKAATPVTRTSSNGVYGFSIMSNQTVRITGLSKDTTYVVSEKALPSGYSKVSEDGCDGTIESDKTKTATITNSYQASGSATLSVTKQASGLDVSGWSFELVDSKGKTVSTARSDSSGKVTFPALSYQKNSTKDETGTYTYTIHEVKGTRTDVKYDSHTVTARVTVTDNGDGTLACKVTTSGSTTFTNTATAVMPVTGGSGTTAAAIAGIAIVAVSLAAWQIAKRRKA